MDMDKDNRRHGRLPMTQVLDISTSEGIIVKAQGIDISETGLLCRADVEIPKGTFVIFPLTIPSGDTSMTISCEGTVFKCTKNDDKYDIVIDFTE